MYFAMALMLIAGPRFHLLGQLPPGDLQAGECYSYLVSCSKLILLFLSLCDGSVDAYISSNLVGVVSLLFFLIQ